MARKGSDSFDQYCKKAAFMLGFLQVSFAFLAVLLNTFAVFKDIEVATIGYGIFSAPVWLIAGSLEIASSLKPSRCILLPTMVISIIAACTVLIYLPLCVIQILNIKTEYFDKTHRVYLDDFCSTCDYKIKWYAWESCSRCFGAFIPNDNYIEEKMISYTMLFVGVFEGIVAAIASSLCCHVICCCRRETYYTANITKEQQNSLITTNHTLDNMDFEENVTKKTASTNIRHSPIHANDYRDTGALDSELMHRLV